MIFDTTSLKIELSKLFSSSIKNSFDAFSQWEVAIKSYITPSNLMMKYAKSDGTIEESKLIVRSYNSSLVTLFEKSAKNETFVEDFFKNLNEFTNNIVLFEPAREYRAKI